MCRQAYTVTVVVLELPTQRHEWLDIPSGPDDMYNDVEGQWSFGGPTIGM